VCVRAACAALMIPVVSAIGPCQAQKKTATVVTEADAAQLCRIDCPALTVGNRPSRARCSSSAGAKAMFTRGDWCMATRR
jgi:hypothetical protein